MATITLESKSKAREFLELLTNQKVLEKSDISILLGKYQTPEEIFESLEGTNKDEEDLVRAYARFKKIPFTDLREAEPQVMVAMPKNLMEKYLIIPYKFEKRALKVALARPTRISQANREVLGDIERRSGVKVEVVFTSKRALRKALEKYPREKRVKTLFQEKEDRGLPQISLKEKKIPLPVLEKIPRELAEKYQMVVFEAPTSEKVKIGVVDPDNPKTGEILNFIREKNHLETEVYKISPEDFALVLKMYEGEKGGEREIRETQQPVRPISQIRPRGLPQKPALSPRPSLPSQPSKPSPLPSLPKSPPKVELELKPEEKEKAAIEKSLDVESVFEESDLDKFLPRKIEKVEDLAFLSQSGNVPHIVGGIIALAAHLDSSDIHLEPQERELRVRYRIDGVLQEILTLPLPLHRAIVSRFKILSKMKLDESRIPQDGRFDVKVAGHEIDLRISTLPTVRGEKVVSRLLDKSAGVIDLPALGLDGVSYDRVVEVISRSYGVVLSTGPTGSGKSTTLYAILKRLSKPGVNIITLEDPVEYEISGINQTQVKPQIGFSFAEGLRSILRQDPNIIMVGEIRDGETAGLVTHAALTGHLVLSTLHTNDAAGALPRLINMGIEPFLITSAINAIIAQRLVRKLCPHCRKPSEIPQAVLFEIKKQIESLNITQPLKFYKANLQGCSQCNAGYKGRIGIFEVLKMSLEIEDLAIKRRASQEIQGQAVKEGMITLMQDGIIKAMSGLTTLDEVMRVTSGDIK